MKYLKVNEALKPSQFREYVKDHDKEKYKDIFMKYNDDHDRNFYRIYLNIENKKSETHQKIEDLLSENGYEIVDYIEGKAKFKGARNLSRIGQVLQRLERNLPEKSLDIKSLMKQFIEDPERKAGQNLMVCISRHPYDIAGSDTDRNWTNCLTMSTQDSNRYIRYMEGLKRKIKNFDFDKIKSEIESQIDDYPEIEAVDVDEFHGDIEDTIVSQLDKFNIDFDIRLMYRYEDEDGFVETDNILFNDLCGKWNEVIDSIMKITDFVVSGSNVKYIKCHVSEGVLMSYLIEKDDKNINKPIANLDIKPYTNVFDPNDIYLKCDDKMYGQGTPDFKQTVEDWLSKVNGNKSGIYYLSENIYNDNHQNRCLLVENGKINSGGESSLREGSKSSKDIVEQYKKRISTIQSDQEAESFIQNFIRQTKNSNLSSDFRIEIRFATPEKWEEYFKRNMRIKKTRYWGW